MKLRKWKIAALLATTGILFQAAGCTTLIFQILAQQVFTTALRSLIEGALGTGSGTTTDDGSTP